MRENGLTAEFVCDWADHRARAEAGRGWYPRVGEEQEGVHRENGQVAHRKRSGAADGEPGPRLLRGTALFLCVFGDGVEVTSSRKPAGFMAEETLPWQD